MKGSWFLSLAEAKRPLRRRTGHFCLQPAPIVRHVSTAIVGLPGQPALQLNATCELAQANKH